MEETIREDSMQKEMENLLASMANHRKMFYRVKAFFGYMDEGVIGHKSVKAGTYYGKKGLNVTLQFDNPITREYRSENNKITRWLNENFLIRLYALLKSYGIVSEKVKIDKTIHGHKELDILRRLRQKFAYSSGQYNPNDPDQKELVRRLVEHFRLSIEDHPREFPLAIDTVIDPLFDKCVAYVRGKFANERG